MAQMSKKTPSSMLHGFTHVLRRELRALTRTRWVGVVGFLTITAHSLLTASLAMGTSPRSSTAIIAQVFYVGFGISMTLCVLLSMRTFAEEFAQDTWSVLATSPISSPVIVGAKWMSCLMTSMGITLCTLPPLLFIAYRGDIAPGHLLAGFLGLGLMQSASLAIGVAASTLGPRQLVAASLTSATLLVLTSTWLLAAIAPPPIDTLLLQMSFFDGNFKGFMEGRVTLSEVIYYLGITGVTLLGATQIVRLRRHA